MKSIRWSLLLYILILLGAAFGVISTFVYENTRQVLEKKQATEAVQLRAKHKSEVDAARADLDRELLLRAQALASQAQFQVNFAENHLRWQVLVQLSLLARAAGPEDVWQRAGFMREAVKNPLAYYSKNPMPGGLQRPNLAEIWFGDRVPAAEHAGQGEDHYYFQINANFDDAIWRSPSLGTWCLPFDKQVFAEGDVVSSKVEDKELQELPAEGVPVSAPGGRAAATGTRVRCVSLKVPIASGQVQPMRGGNGPRGNAPNGGRGNGAERGPFPRQGDRYRPPDFVTKVQPEHLSWLFYIQYACDSNATDRAIAGANARQEEALRALDDDSRAMLSTLGGRLLLISLATFAATVAGGCWLVGHGMKPLRRLSEAVSRVSEKDFHLPFQEPRLPIELRPIVERLQDTLELLKRAFEREKQAAADISHDLRTPIAALLTTTEVALRKPRTAEDYREVIEDCRATGQQISQIVERLLALARLDAGVDRLRPREVDVAEVAEQCASMVRPLAEARELTVRVNHEGPMQLVTDPDKFREVLSNLLHNAIEYNRPRGSVEVTLARQNGHLQVEIRDTGIGIAPQVRQRIFERFFRADPSRHADGQHSGLGLAIVKGYLDLMGGSIDVESAEGKGSTFRVVLPVA